MCIGSALKFWHENDSTQPSKNKTWEKSCLENKKTTSSYSFHVSMGESPCCISLEIPIIWSTSKHPELRKYLDPPKKNRYMGVEPKIRVFVPPPNHPFVHRVWNHYFHHPFWGPLNLPEKTHQTHLRRYKHRLKQIACMWTRGPDEPKSGRLFYMGCLVENYIWKKIAINMSRNC